jgi:hypothetical protein
MATPGVSSRSKESLWKPQRKTRVFCPRDRHDAQAQRVSIITGALHTVFPRTRGKPEARYVRSKDEASSMPGKRRVRRFSPIERKTTFLFPEPTLDCRRNSECTPFAVFITLVFQIPIRAYQTRGESDV